MYIFKIWLWDTKFMDGFFMPSLLWLSLSLTSSSPQLPHNLPTFKQFFQYFSFPLLYYLCSTILTSIKKCSSSWPRLSFLDSTGPPSWLHKMRNLKVKAIYKGEHVTFVFLRQVILLGIAFYGCCCFYSPPIHLEIS